MASRFRTLFFASAALAVTLCASGLFSSGADAATKEPEGGVFPGEESRLPGEEERKALGLIFREADLFLAPHLLAAAGGGAVRGGGGVSTPPAGGSGGAVRVFLALKNPKNFSSKKTAEGAPRPPMDFLGWGLTAVRGEILSAAGFGPSGRFRGGAASPRGRMPAALSKLLASLVRRWPGPAAERLSAYAEIDPKRAAGLGLEVWLRIFERFGEVHRAAKDGVRRPPARTVPGLPGPAAAVKILLAILVIMIVSLFNVGLTRQRRRRMREEMARKFDKGGVKWKV